MIHCGITSIKYEKISLSVIPAKRRHHSLINHHLKDITDSKCKVDINNNFADDSIHSTATYTSTLSVDSNHSSQCNIEEDNIINTPHLMNMKNDFLQSKHNAISSPLIINGNNKLDLSKDEIIHMLHVYGSPIVANFESSINSTKDILDEYYQWKHSHSGIIFTCRD